MTLPLGGTIDIVEKWMVIGSRIAQLLRANVVSFMDRVANNRRVLQRYMETMKATLKEKEDSLSRLKEEIDHQRKKLISLQKEVKGYEEDITLCLNRGREDIATTLFANIPHHPAEHGHICLGSPVPVSFSKAVGG